MLEHGGLPLPDDDRMSLPAPGHRIRPLTAGEVRQRPGCGRGHASRPAT